MTAHRLSVVLSIFSDNQSSLTSLIHIDPWRFLGGKMLGCQTAGNPTYKATQRVERLCPYQ
jgi:hypothetical protein